MNSSDLIIKELETVVGSDEEDTMKSDERRFSVSYGMFKDFTVRTEKNQHFAVVGNYVKKQFKNSVDPAKKKAFGNYFYDLNFGSILKRRYRIEIAIPALKSIKDVQNINILSDVSLQIGQAVKAAIEGVIGEMTRIQTSTLDKKQKAAIADDSDYIGIRMDELAELKDAAAVTVDLNDQSTEEEKDKFRALGVLFSRYYGNLMNTPKEILSKAKKAAGIKRKTTDQIGEEFEEMVVSDPTNPKILDYLMESLIKPSSKDSAGAQEALDSFRKAPKKAKTEMRDAYFTLIGSLDYHIETKFKFFEAKQVEKVNELYKAWSQYQKSIYSFVASQIVNYLRPEDANVELIDPNQMMNIAEGIDDLASFKGFLKKAINIEKTTGEKKSKEEKAKQRKSWLDEYKEFMFVAEQPEGKVGVDSVKDYYIKSFKLYDRERYKEANEMLLKIMEEGSLGESSWNEIRKAISSRKIKELQKIKLEKQEEVSILIAKYNKISEEGKLVDLEKKYKELIVASKKDKSAVDISDKDLQDLESDPKGFGGIDLEEQITKILAPYLMERIKNRKPIDQRLINILKPRKSQKGKSK